MQDVYQLHYYNYAYEKTHLKTIYLQQNELTLQDDMVGFLSKESEPINFLSVEREEKMYSKEFYRPGIPNEPYDKM